MTFPRLLVVQHEPECPPALLGDWLEEAGCALDVRHPYRGDDLPTLEAYDALVLLGGAMGADATPVLGVCLGHQLVASALGGRVERNPAGQQVGVLPVGWTAAAHDDALFGPMATPRRGLHWNNDVVTALPDGAVMLASAPGGEVQVVRFAERVWGVQLHPEVDDAIVRLWAADEQADGPGDRSAMLAELAGARAELDAAWRPLAQRFAAIAAGAHANAG